MIQFKTYKQKVYRCKFFSDSDAGHNFLIENLDYRAIVDHCDEGLYCVHKDEQGSTKFNPKMIHIQNLELMNELSIVGHYAGKLQYRSKKYNTLLDEPVSLHYFSNLDYRLTLLKDAITHQNKLGE